MGKSWHCEHEFTSSSVRMEAILRSTFLGLSLMDQTSITPHVMVDTDYPYE
ncbi:unnamed protein product, partial [Brassica oleracea]